MQYPEWLNRSEYPFTTRYIDVGPGRMHYVDAGPLDAPHTVLFLHGNPTWSFEYRNVIRQLGDRYRCVAPDWLGFGLSDEPKEWSYRPQDHARCLSRFITLLDARSFTLVVHDWGGPIGLSYAINHPESIQSIVVLNSWLWPPSESLRLRTFARIAGSAPANFLIRSLNALTIAIPLGFGHPARVTKAAYAHYVRAQQRGRLGCAQLPGEFTGSEDWLSRLWSRRAMLTAIPMAVVWGKRDPVLGTKPLARWLDAFPTSELTVLEDVGHFVPEEAPEAVVNAIHRVGSR